MQSGRIVFGRMKEVVYGKPAAEVHVSGEKVRMERSGDGFAMLADTGTGTLTMIDHRKRTYTVMDRAAITAMNAQMKQMQQAMQAQLANLHAGGAAP